MASYKQSMREAGVLVFSEVCIDSLVKESQFGEHESRLFQRAIMHIGRAWKVIRDEGLLDQGILIRRQTQLSMALKIIWKDRLLDGRIILAALMELGESTWNTAKPERRKPWNDLISTLQELFSSTEDDAGLSLVYADLGETVADVVKMVVFDGMRFDMAAERAVQREVARGNIEIVEAGHAQG